MVELFTPAREPSRTVGHQSTALRRSDLRAQVRLGAATELAVPTLRRVEGDDVVSCTDKHSGLLYVYRRSLVGNDVVSCNFRQCIVVFCMPT